jgi:hypothetical protein
MWGRCSQREKEREREREREREIAQMDIEMEELTLLSSSVKRLYFNRMCQPKTITITSSENKKMFFAVEARCQ